MSEFKHLFSPIKIGSHEIKNRIVSSAHGEGLANNGLLNEKLIRYHEKKATGGTGLVMTFGSGSVYEKFSPSRYVSLWNPKNEPFLKDLAKRVHEHGALIMSQATHKGRRGNSKESGIPIQAPSGIPEPVNGEIPHVLRTDEIKPIVKAFADAAARLERCGFDGVEITSYGGHLIEQFWSPAINKRTDQYGGDLTGRMRFSVEVIEAVSEAVSDKFIIGFRMTGDPLTDSLGLDQDDMLEIAKRLDDLGRIDLFHISGGTGATLTAQAGTIPPDSFSRGCYNHLSHRMKEHLSVPVLVAGRILDPIQAEESLESGDCDLVAMTRALIADPDMPNLAKAGKISRIRPCIGSNEGCIGRTFSSLPIACVVNPGIADNSLYKLNAVNNPKRILVIGGGPSGLEAARVAAQRGHKVVLFERSEYLGGQVIPASAAPNRPHFGLHNSWLKNEIERLQVEVRAGTKANVNNILEQSPDSVIIATGAETVIPPEAEGVTVKCVTDVDVLEKRLDVRKYSRVFVYDVGGLRGGYVANFVAEAGASKVELASPLLAVCEELDDTTKPSIYRALAKNNVICTPNQYLVSQREGNLILRDAWSDIEREVRDVDLIIFAGFRNAVSYLRDELLEKKPDLDVFLVGDSVAPRMLRDAVAEGARAGNRV